MRSAAQIREKIAEIDTLISVLTTTALKSVSTGHFVEYDLDTGQSRTRIKYQSTSAVVQSLQDYENLRQFYVNKLIGTRVVRLVDSKNFRRS